MRSPALASVMTPFPYSIEADATVREARAMMAEHGIRHLPVTRGEQILGVISDGDLLLAGNLAPDGAANVKVEAIATREPYVVDLAERLDHVLSVMTDRHIGSAVVTRHGKLVGIFTHTDACRLLAAHLRGEGAPPDDVA